MTELPQQIQNGIFNAVIDARCAGIREFSDMLVQILDEFTDAAPLLTIEQVCHIVENGAREWRLIELRRRK